MKVVRHRLVKDDGTAYTYHRSPNVGDKLDHKYLIIHYTAGSTVSGAVSTLTTDRGDNSVSAHLVIGRDGSVVQLVPFDRVAWHAGASRWGSLEGLNAYSIGIELDNAGVLSRQGNKWRAWFGREYSNDEVLEAIHKNRTILEGWHLYPPEQLETTLTVAGVLIKRYSLQAILGHDDISPGRKTDPGPAFPMANFQANLFGRGEDTLPQYKTTANLNIRTGPGTQNEKLSASPLPQGTRVELLERQGVWWQVDVLDTIKGDMDIQGWVHSRYLQESS